MLCLCYANKCFFIGPVGGRCYDSSLLSCFIWLKAFLKTERPRLKLLELF
jgi:hypothetical protein